MNKRVEICRYCGGKIYWLKDERGDPKPVDVTKKWFITFGSGDTVRMVSGYQLHQPTCNARHRDQARRQPPRQEDDRPRRPY